MNAWEKFKGWFGGSAAESKPPVYAVSSLPDAGFRIGFDDGTKFAGGFGPTQLLTADYWTLRARSVQLFETNHYARGIIRRLVTNEINTGLHLECTPIERILGLPEDSLADWSEEVELRFDIWSKDPWLCDHYEMLTFGGLQRVKRMTALIDGDVLTVLRQHPVTRLPRIQLISGSAVRSPHDVTPRAGSRIVHGVELDSFDRQVAFWVVQRDGSFKRIPAWGEKSGRRLAWLTYGTEKRLEDVRGKPFLSLVMQSLKEIDRYRDSAQRKAVINSMLAMFIKKDEAKPGTQPIAAGGISRGRSVAIDNSGRARSFNTVEHIPGLVLDELQQGETPQAFGAHGTDEKFGDFESTMIQSIAWLYEIPPEILQLSFGSNYSASQAAINEFKMYLNKRRTEEGEQFCQPIYEDWLVSMALSGKIKADRLLESWRDDRQYDVFSAYTSADWSGHIKPAVDASKLVRGYIEQIEHGLITHDRASREINGTKYSSNIKKLKRENEMLADANKSLVDAGLLGTPPAPDVPEQDPNAEPTNQEDDADSSSAKTPRRVA